jgi:hypothetical protein
VTANKSMVAFESSSAHIAKWGTGDIIRTVRISSKICQLRANNRNTLLQIVFM